MDKKDTEHQFKLRLPIALYEKIRTQAEANGRSVNSEMVTALKNYVDGENKKQKRG